MKQREAGLARGPGGGRLLSGLPESLGGSRLLSCLLGVPGGPAELLFKFPEPYSKFPLANYFTYGNVSFHVTLSLHLTLSSPLPTSLPASFLRKGPQPQNCQLYKKCTKMSLQGFKFWQQFSLVSFFGLYHTNLHKSSFTQTQPFKIPQSLRKERRSIN